jgi:hypothetical protein
VRVAINLHFWGTLVTTPHAAAGEWPGAGALLAESAQRLLGALFDQRHGLLPLAPAYLLVAAGFVLLRQRRPREAAGIAAVTLPYLALILCPLTNVHGWRGGWSPAARFLVPVAPLLAACVVEVIARGRWRAAAVPLLAAQGVIAALLWQRPMLAWAEGPGFAPLLSALAAPLAAVLPRWDPPAPGAWLASTGMALAAAALAWAAARPAREPS